MRITPLDARKQEFRKAVRGFDCDEVRAFLSTLADEYETVLVDNKQLRERVMEQEDKIAEYKNIENTLRDTLMTAERAMQDTRENANREGELIVQEAHQKSRQVLEECRVRTEELRRELVGLRKEKETYLARYKSLAESQIHFIESHRNDFEDLDKRLVSMVDSVIEGVGEHSAAVTSAAVASAPAREPEPSSPPAFAAAPAREPAPAAAPAPTSAPTSAPTQERDIWRDYQPLAGENQEAAAAAPSPSPRPEPAAAPPPPVANPWATAPAAETPAPAQAAPPQDSPASPLEAPADAPGTRQDPAAAAVDLAAMGIPVPAVPRADEADLAVAALSEEAEPEPEVHSVW